MVVVGAGAASAASAANTSAQLSARVVERNDLTWPEGTLLVCMAVVCLAFAYAIVKAVRR